MIRRSLAVDLGTVNTLVYVNESGVILREPTLAAVEKGGKGEIAAAGARAVALLKKDPEHLEPIMPLQRGVIENPKVTGKLLRYFLRRSLGRYSRFFPAPCVAVCVPGGVTEKEKKALQSVCFAAGAADCLIISESLAAAVGAGLPVNAPRGSMVVNIGGGVCETAVISLGAAAAEKSACIGGSCLNEAIRNYVRSAYGLFITESQAENVKINLGSAVEPRSANTMHVRGIRVEDKTPAEIRLNSVEIFGTLIPCLKELANTVKKTLEEAPPELAGDILRQGITLTGGGALLPGMDVFLYRMTGVPTVMCENPLDAAALGAGKIAKNMRSMPRNSLFRKEAVYHI